MAHRDPKHPSPEDAALAAESDLRPRSEWSKRLDLFVRGGRSASAADPGADADWEVIRPPAPAPSLFSDPLASSAAGLSPHSDSEHEQLELGLAAARREIADREAENVGLRGALGAAHQQLRAREAEITDLTTRLAVANATTTSRQDELTSLGGRYSGIEEKRNALEREVQLMREKLQRAAEESEKHAIKIDNLRTTRATLEETVQARDRIIKARDEELGACEQELQAHRDRIANQYKNMADRDAEMAMLNDQLLAEQERTRNLEAEVGARNQMLDHHREKLAQRDEQLASLLATLDVVERTINTRSGVPDLAEGIDEASRPATPLAKPPPPAPPHAEAAVAAHAPEPTPPIVPAAKPAFSEFQPEPAHQTEPEPEPEREPEHEPIEAAAEPPAAADEAAHSEPIEADPAPEPADVVAEQTDADVANEEQAEPEPAESSADVDAEESAPSVDASEPDVASEVAEAKPSEEATQATAADADEGEAPAPASDTVISAEAFAQELAVLEPSGDLFSQRPPAQPAIFHWWRDQRIAEHLVPLEVASFDDLVAGTVARQCAARREETISILSLCGADPELELRLARKLKAQGHDNFVIDCIDDREGWHDVRTDLAEASGLADQIDSLSASSASLGDDQQYDVFVADGSLAYVADLPGLLTWIRQAWKDDSTMVLGAVLGACAAPDSPENVETIDRIWNVMPDHYMRNHVTGTEQTSYSAANPASDAPGSGGPLSPGSEPLLPLLLDEFCFEVFAPFGNLINAFVGPEVGPNFDPEDEDDRNFIERFAKLDEAQIDAGGIHPVHLTAVLRSTAGANPFLLENRVPERCLQLGE